MINLSLFPGSKFPYNDPGNRFFRLVEVPFVINERGVFPICNSLQSSAGLESTVFFSTFLFDEQL